MKKICLLLSLLTPLSAYSEEKRCVILLHGLARTHFSMSSIESSLKRHHYLVVNKNYPSTRKSIDYIASNYIQEMVDECQSQKSDKIMFVTHSMGGIVLQRYLKNHKVKELSHIVMLSPPNHGSPLADMLCHNWFYKTIMGPSGQELTTYNMSKNTNTSKSYQIGIIAGSYNLSPFSKSLFHEQNDGKVSVSSSKMLGMKDFIVMPVSHSFMMNNSKVKRQILCFLEYGKFCKLT
ncbi:MAG: hypothetical protein P1U74_08485 [Legionellaceae bacterium]|nr:hypothetical protein [Legionellaceae bacterium]